jgi:hypothetical protein
MNFGLLFRTVSHLKTTQIVYQALYRLNKHKYCLFFAPIHEVLRLYVEPIPRYGCLEGDKFVFLNLGHKLLDWNFVGHGTLWTYNMSYFDFINQIGISQLDGCQWIDKFIEDLQNITWGLDPYPIALRGINWIKFFCRHPETATKKREDSLYSQYKLLEKKLEYHLLGNHLLEDAYSLFIGSLYFEDKALYEKASKLLEEQLEEQTLMDGAHYEQSPMYHCILLDRLLDCINFAKCKVSSGFVSSTFIEGLLWVAKKQLGWLEAITWSDGDIPLLNDSAHGIAPMPVQIFDYAKRLGIIWSKNILRVSGYRKMYNSRMEAIVDIGNITATYQPGHTHADIFNYELRIDGKPLVVDTGISTYNKNERRQYERSSSAHNCVCALLNGKMLDSSEVWGGFRVGRRANVRVSRDSHESISAEHDGYGKLCARIFTITDASFTIEDSFGGEAVSLIHLAPGVTVESQEARVESIEPRVVRTNLGVIKIEGAGRVDIVDEKASTEYNRFDPIKVLKIYFKDHLKYTIE